MQNKQFTEIIEESDLPDYQKSFCLNHLEIYDDLLKSFQAKSQMYQMNAELYDKICQQLFNKRVLLNAMITKYGDRFTQEELIELQEGGKDV